MSLRDDTANSISKRGRRKGKFYDCGKNGYLDLLSLRISRYWYQEPSWFDQQDRRTKTALIAEYILTHETPDAKKKRRNEHQKKTAERWRKKS